MNTVNIIGNLTRDVEIKYTGTGKAVANISIAVNKNYTKGDGEKIQEVSYFDVEVWGATAENCQRYISKGSKIAVVGELKQERWDQGGNTRSRVKIVANRVEFLTPKKEGSHADDSQPENYSGKDEEVEWTE